MPQYTHQIINFTQTCCMLYLKTMQEDVKMYYKSLHSCFNSYFNLLIQSLATSSNPSNSSKRIKLNWCITQSKLKSIKIIIKNVNIYTYVNTK